MSVDGQCAIVGNGNQYVCASWLRSSSPLPLAFLLPRPFSSPEPNLTPLPFPFTNRDTQSFMHSQEANVLIDSPQIVSDWMDQLATNQSTHRYGKVDTDGIWRDPVSKEPLAAPERVSCFSAVWAMVK
jgi:hypothetical protein